MNSPTHQIVRMIKQFKYVIIAVELSFIIAMSQIVNDHMTIPIDSGWSLVESDTTFNLTMLDQSISFPVVATIYHPVKEQTDSTPNIVASGRKINIRKAGSYRIVAVSRDLLTRWGGPINYGDIVYISGAEELSGYYIVEDTMNKRYTMRVDILRTPGAPIAKYDNAKLHMGL